MVFLYLGYLEPLEALMFYLVTCDIEPSSVYAQQLCSYYLRGQNDLG